MHNQADMTMADKVASILHSKTISSDVAADMIKVINLHTDRARPVDDGAADAWKPDLVIYHGDYRGKLRWRLRLGSRWNEIELMINHDVAAIARGLNSMQRQILDWPSRIEDWREIYAYRLAGGAPGVNAARQLFDAGLLERRWKPWWVRRSADFSILYRLSPLGLAVRNYLQGSKR